MPASGVARSSGDADLATPAPKAQRGDVEEVTATTAVKELIAAIAADRADAADADNDHDHDVNAIYCDISGELINNDVGYKWQADELEKIKNMNTYRIIDSNTAKKEGIRVIGTRFAMNKAKQKARLVVQDVRHGMVEAEHWAPTPSTTTLRTALTLGSSLGHGATVTDISSAFLNAELPPDLRVAVRPPVGFGKPGELWLLLRSLYGLRSAPALWAKHLGWWLKTWGLKQSVLDPGLFYDGVGHDLLLVVVHVDDLVIIGAHSRRATLMKKVRNQFELKDEKELESPGSSAGLLGRTLFKTAKGFSLTNDVSYAEDLARIFGLDDGSKESPTPAATTRPTGQPQQLDDGMARQLRTAIGKILWLSGDRPDLRYVAGRLATQVGYMTDHTWQEAKRVARYLLSHPVGATALEARGGGVDVYVPSNSDDFKVNPAAWQPEVTEGSDSAKRRKKGQEVQVFCDSDWAGDLATRRSVSGGALFLMGALVATWSRRQATVALSSAEAELAALTTAIAEATFVRNLITEVINEVPHVNFYSDSSAARSIAARRGVTPRVKHLAIKALYAQQYFAESGAKLLRVCTKENPADLMTKALPADASRKHWTRLGFTAFGPRDLEHHVGHINAKFSEDRRRDMKHHAIFRCMGSVGQLVSASGG